jgi:hypothetical protein
MSLSSILYHVNKLLRTYTYPYTTKRCVYLHFSQLTGYYTQNHNAVKLTKQYNPEICYNLYPCQAAMIPTASAQNESEWCRKSELISIIQEHQLTASASL